MYALIYKYFLPRVEIKKKKAQHNYEKKSKPNCAKPAEKTVPNP